MRGLVADAHQKFGGKVNMGFSLVAAFAVISVSIFIALEVFTGTLLPAITDCDDSYDDMVGRSIDRVQTDINITDISTSVYGSNYNHSITVENTGSISLKTSDFVVLINGTVREFSCPDSYLYPEKTTYFNVSDLPGTGDMRCKLVTDNGISDYYEYTI